MNGLCIYIYTCERIIYNIYIFKCIESTIQLKLNIELHIQLLTNKLPD